MDIKSDTPDSTAVRPGCGPETRRELGRGKGNPTGLSDLLELDLEDAEMSREAVHTTGMPSARNPGDSDEWFDDPFKPAHQFTWLDDDDFNSLFEPDTYAELSGRSPAEARGSHQLMVVLATINGCRVRVLLDSGCTSELIIDERAAG